MDLEFAKRLLDILIENSMRILVGGFGVNCAEVTFFEVVQLLKDDTRLRGYFLSRVKDTLDAPNPGALQIGLIPPELIELASHELRWPEFLELAKNRVIDRFDGDDALAVGDVATHIPEAFNDNWADREFYSRYQSRNQS